MIVAIILKAMDQSSYYMETSYVQINFVSFPLRLIITPEEEAAVAKQLAISGKLMKSRKIKIYNKVYLVH